jgi:hypothetical protein
MNTRSKDTHYLVQATALVMLASDSEEDVNRYSELLANRLAAACPEWQHVQVELATIAGLSKQATQRDDGVSGATARGNLSTTTTTTTGTTSSTVTTTTQVPSSGGGGPILEVRIQYEER